MPETLEELVNNREEEIISKLQKRKAPKKWLPRQVFYFFASVVCGNLPSGAQERIGGEIGLSPRKITSYHAVVSITTATIEFIALQYGGSWVLDQLSDSGEIFETAKYIMQEINSLYYYYIKIPQQAFRLGYANITEKGLVSVGLWSAVINSVYFMGRGVSSLVKIVRKKINKLIFK